MIDNAKQLNEVFALLGLPALKPTVVNEAVAVVVPAAKLLGGKVKSLAPTNHTLRAEKECTPAATVSRPLLPALTNCIYPASFNVLVANQSHLVKFWKQERIEAEEIGCDTETTLIKGYCVPELAVMTASSGVETYIIHPKDVISFFEIHKSTRLVFHHVAFDFYVLLNHFQKQGRDDLVSHLWERAVQNQLGDSMILDQLIRLATTGEFPSQNDLAVVADTWCGIKEVDKSSPYRLRYGEIIDKDWTTVEEGYFHYAAKDAIATALIYQALKKRAMELAGNRINDCWPNAIKRFGPLTEAVQIRGAIGLASVERLGMGCNPTALARLDQQLESAITRTLGSLRELPESADLFLINKQGCVERTECGAPRIKNKRLQAILSDIELRGAGIGLPVVPRTTRGELSVAEDDWRAYRDHFQFIALWLDLLKYSKSGQFTKSRGSAIHPKYNLLVLTGRVSCIDPNLQQMPRCGGFRECYIPRERYVLFTIDYKYIELITFSAIATKMFGGSHLGNIIKTGVDPHCFTAAMLNDMTIEAFMDLKDSDPVKFKDFRQKAKAINFGILGGQGAVSLVAYARENYNVVLTLEQAETWRGRLITEVYPEICLYLADRSLKVLADNLGCTKLELWAGLEPRGKRPLWFPIALQRILAGENKRNGERYNPRFCEQIWSGLASCCQNELHRPMIVARKAGKEMAALLRESVVTPSGRIRASCAYTEARNSPFQGLASDGAKEAIFELVRLGYRVVGFVHDELILELPVDVDHTAEAKRIEQIVCEAMSSVIDNTVPVSADYALSTVWSKEAKCVFDKMGRLIPWKPKEDK